MAAAPAAASWACSGTGFAEEDAGGMVASLQSASAKENNNPKRQDLARKTYTAKLESCDDVKDM